MFPGTHAATQPDKPAVIMAESGDTLTYGELDSRSASIARALRDFGLRRGDVIALLSDNSLAAFEIYWAALRSGLYITAVNWHLAADEAAYIVNDSGARVLFVSGGARSLAEAVRPLTPDVERFFAFGGPVDGYVGYDELVSGESVDPNDQPRGTEMLYSSGTTGRPKGIKPRLPEISVDEPGDPLVGMMQHAFGISAADRYLSPAPIYH